MNPLYIFIWLLIISMKKKRIYDWCLSFRRSYFSFADFYIVVRPSDLQAAKLSNFRLNGVWQALLNDPFNYDSTFPFFFFYLSLFLLLELRAGVKKVVLLGGGARRAPKNFLWA